MLGAACLSALRHDAVQVDLFEQVHHLNFRMMLIPEETHLGESRRIMAQRSFHTNHRISTEKAQSSRIPGLCSLRNQECNVAMIPCQGGFYYVFVQILLILPRLSYSRSNLFLIHLIPQLCIVDSFFFHYESVFQKAVYHFLDMYIRYWAINVP